jgi:hypothetical protein
MMMMRDDKEGHLGERCEALYIPPTREDAHAINSFRSS